MELDKLKLKNVLYYMQSFLLDVAGTEFDMPRTMIGSFQINKMYEEMVYPLYYINALLPPWLFAEMTKNPDDIHVTMDFQYALEDDVDKILRGDGKFKSEIKGKFKVVLPDLTQIADFTHQSQIAKADKSFKQGYSYNEAAMVEMLLYNESAYQAAYNTINDQLANVTPYDALIRVLNMCKINDGRLFSKPDNNKTYSQFNITPQCGVKNVLRIVDELTLHDPGSIVFFDLTDTYVITKKIGCYAWRNNEHKTLYIMSLAQFSETLERFSGIHIDDEKKESILLIPSDAFRIQRPDSSPDLRKGGESTFLMFQTRNALLNLLSPNKEYSFTVDDTGANAYNGKYRIYSMEADFTPRGEFLDPAFTVYLRK